MKALFLTASYPTDTEPLLGIFVKEHARAVAAAGVEVRVVHLDRAPVRRIRVERTDDDELPTWLVRYPRSPAPWSYAGNVLAAAAGYVRVRRSGFDPDVLHAHFFLAAAPAVVLGRLFRKPVVATEQWSVFLPEDPLQLKPLMRRVARDAFTRCDLVMPVSEALANGIRGLGGRIEVRVVPNVVDTSLFHPDGARTPADGPRRLVGVGALYEAKGWEDLLDALALLGARRRDVHLSLIGDGHLRPALEERAERAGLHDLVTFTGWLPKPEVAERVRSADLFVLASRYDSNPCAAIEALASGVPVVGTAVGGIPELVSEGTGVLARPGDPASIAACIEDALDRGTWDRGRIAAGAAGRYGREAVGRAFAEAYEEVVARRR